MNIHTSPTLRLVEAAADEIGRLDLAVRLSPASVAIALRSDAVAQLTRRHDAQGIAVARASLVAASVDPLHATTLDPALNRTQALVQRAESLLRSGLPLSMARLQALAPETALDPQVLEPILSPGGQPRSALVRALEAAAALDGGPLADLIPAMLLGSAGMSHRLHFLPFAECDPAPRAEAVASSGDDDGLALARLALGVAAESARVRRMAIESGLARIREDADRLAPLGRAAITARRALEVLRGTLAATMPSLSATLECSRPAAGDALERLVEVGLAREITGRGRDRVYADALAWDVPPL